MAGITTSGGSTAGATTKAVRLTKTANVEINHASDTLLSWDSERRDDGDLHDLVTNPSRITIPDTGWWFVGANIAYESGGGNRRQTYLRLNGSDIIALNASPPVSGVYTVQNLSTLWYFTANDYVECLVFQDSGGGLDVQGNTAAGYGAEFWAMAGISISGGVSGVDAWVVDIDTIAPATANTNWNTIVPGNLYGTDSAGKGLAYYASKDSSGVMNDEIQFKRFFPAGTYTMSVVAHKDANRGIITAYLDATNLGTMDLYNASSLYNQIVQITSISVSAGFQTLKFKMETKHGSSSGFYGCISKIRMERTA